MRLGAIVALICQRYCRGMIARKKFLRLRKLEQQRLTKLKVKAAKTIQRYTRGMLGRILVGKKRLARDMLDIKRWQACILIQTIIRKRKGRNKYNLLKRNKSMLKRKLKQWRLWRIRRIPYIITIQKTLRMAIAKRRTNRLKKLRNTIIKELFNQIIDKNIEEVGEESNKHVNDKLGWNKSTPLMLACLLDRDDIVSSLIKREAKLNLKNSLGKQL
jgi:hypothetical protein